MEVGKRTSAACGAATGIVFVHAVMYGEITVQQNRTLDVRSVAVVIDAVARLWCWLIVLHAHQHAALTRHSSGRTSSQQTYSVALASV